MYRVLKFLIVIVLLVAGAVWLADNPGAVTIKWQGYRVDASFTVLMLTVAAIAVIAIVNWRAPDQPLPPPVNIAAAIPAIELKAETAMLTGPLQQELDRLQSDLKKAEEKVKREIGL